MLLDRIKKLLYYTPINPYFISKYNLLRAMKYSSRYANGLLVDVGCGKKPYFHIYSGRVSQYIGIDYPPPHESADKYMDVIADGQMLPVRNGSVDTVVCNQVLEHIPDTVLFINNLSLILKSGGHLILTVPFFWGLHEEPRDYYRFTKYGLEYLFSNNCFHIEEIKNLSGYFGMIFQRLSDILFNSFRGAFGLVGVFLILPVTIVLQIFGFILDQVFFHKGDNLDWLLIARKK